jgi:glucuronate isomerase
MHLDPEDKAALLEVHAARRDEFLDAKAKADHNLPDFVTKPFRHRFVGDTLELVTFGEDMSADEMLTFAKQVMEMAEAKKVLERQEREMRAAGLTV